MSDPVFGQGDHGFVRRLFPLVGGVALIVIGVLSLRQGKAIVSGVTILIGLLSIVTALYYWRHPLPTVGRQPASSMFLKMSFGWLGLGVATLGFGIAVGGFALAVSLIGFALSMYLWIGMLVAAVRNR